jgi:Cu/Ag efflux pump CusA
VGDVQDVIDLALGASPITGVFEGDRRFAVVARPRRRNVPANKHDAKAMTAERQKQQLPIKKYLKRTSHANRSNQTTRLEKG